LNNAKAKKDLEWEPEYSLDDGMKAVFNWLRT
jgi:nucleoside-diphosphate-sugar epimerase